MSALDELLRSRQLVVCVGPGGVGKTTVAAALGVRAAQLGRRTLVLTIDPARRLITTLGLADLGDAYREVPLRGLGGEAPLYAAMLDPGASFDALVDRIAVDPAHRERILDNRLYRIFSRAFGNAHAYIAMERLHDAVASGGFDLVILDTPPTRNALDILDAPGRLLAFLDERVVGWLLRQPPEGLRARLLARGGAAARKLLALLAGESLVDDLADFLGLFAALRPGFQARADAVQGLLRAPESAFALVTSPLADNLADAAYLRDGLAERGVPLRALVVNRAYVPLGEHPWSIDAPPRASDDDDRARLVDLAGAPAGSADAEADAAGFGVLVGALGRLRHEVAADNRRGQRAIAEFVGAAPPSCLKVQVPLLDHEPQDRRALAGLAALLADPRAALRR
jgi:anion-transporting  ArsA/GET3 family ATPase